MTKKLFRLKCLLCRTWNADRGGYDQSWAWLTDWKPQKGLDQRIREFECSNCHEKQYRLVNEKQLKEMVQNELRADTSDTS